MLAELPIILLPPPQALGLDVAVLTTQWLVAVFSDTLPSECTLQFWGALIQHKDGHVFTLRVIVTLLLMLEPHIMTAEDPVVVLTARSEAGRDVGRC